MRSPANSRLSACRGRRSRRVNSSRCPLSLGHPTGRDVRRGDEASLADSLRADHDLRQGGSGCRKGGQQAVVEPRSRRRGRSLLLPPPGSRRRSPRSGVAIRPARSRCSSAIEWRFQELADLVVHLRVDLPAQLLARLLADRRRRDLRFATERAYACARGRSTSSSSAPPGRCRRPSGRLRRCSFVAGASGCCSTAPGTQRQMLRSTASASSSCARCFLTHYHADHYLGPARHAEDLLPCGAARST